MKQAGIKSLYVASLLALSIVLPSLSGRAQQREAEGKAIRGFIKENTMRRYVLENPMPQYPEAALKTGAHGEVI
ncbi:MAG: hypothetical protein ACREAC_13160, partial [Blastocatellia bacterium]